MVGKEGLALPPLPEKPPPLFPSCRLLLALMILLGTFNLFLMRINLSFALICMVRTTARNIPDGGNGLCFDDKGNNTTSIGPPLEMKTQNLTEDYFDWSKQQQGHILGAYFWGYMVTQLLGGFISDRSSGGKTLSIFGMAVYSLLTLVIPVAADFGINFLIAVRFLQGVFSGLSLPSFHVLCSRWIWDEERGRLLNLSFSGFALAACLTYPIAGVLCQYGFAGGWPSIFYVTGTSGLVWCILCYWAVYDSPLTHPRISSEEREYLRHLVPVKKDVQTGKTQKIPWFRLFTAAPVLAYIVTHFCTNWGFYTIIINLPIFMKEVYNFSTTNNGLLSAVPYIASLVVRFSVGPIYDILLRRKVASTTCLRKIFNSVGLIIPALSMFFIGLLTCSQRYGAVILLTVCSGVNELAFSAGYLFSGMELAPQYIGILTGVANTIGTAPGFISPLVAAALTPNRTKEEWLTVFYVTSGIQLTGAFVYLFFGSSKRLELGQPGDSKTGQEVKNLVEP